MLDEVKGGGGLVGADEEEEGMPRRTRASLCTASHLRSVRSGQWGGSGFGLGVHYAHRYSRKSENIGRRKKYTIWDNMCVRGL